MSSATPTLPTFFFQSLYKNIGRLLKLIKNIFLPYHSQVIADENLLLVNVVL